MITTTDPGGLVMIVTLTKHESTQTVQQQVDYFFFWFIFILFLFCYFIELKISRPTYNTQVHYYNYKKQIAKINFSH